MNLKMKVVVTSLDTRKCDFARWLCVITTISAHKTIKPLHLVATLENVLLTSFHIYNRITTYEKDH